MSYFWIYRPTLATVYHLRAAHHPDYVPALARCSTPERLFWSAHSVGPSAIPMRVCDPDRSPVGSIAETQPKLQPRFAEIVGSFYCLLRTVCGAGFGPKLLCEARNIPVLLKTRRCFSGAARRSYR